MVAIKCVAKKSLNKASVENLLTEIEILKGIRHPHIVQLKDFQWDNDNIYLIMEFCAGGDLSRFIHTRRILPEKVARVFMQQLGKKLVTHPVASSPLSQCFAVCHVVSLASVGNSGFHMENMM